MNNTRIIETHFKPHTLLLELKGVADTVFIKGEDFNKQNSFTVFFNRKKAISGFETLEFPLPLAPEKLKLTVKGIGSSPEIISIRGISLATKDRWLNERDLAFVNAAKVLALQLGYLGPGNYDVNGYEIELSSNIYNTDFETGLKTIANTPARINRKSGKIWLALNKMRGYTVPMRMLILLHEYGHYKLQTSNELEVDLFALDLYLSLGFPKTEALYAFTKVMSGHSSSVQRTEQTLERLLSFINNHA